MPTKQSPISAHDLCMEIISPKKKHFVLVHGFGHGAWCWYKLVALLKSAGHLVTALDLAASGLHPKQLEDIESMADYQQPLMDIMASLPCHEKVVLVGHSFGGLYISFAMEKFPHKVSVAVFISAYMPNCEDPPQTLMEEFFKMSSAESFMDCEFTFDEADKSPISSMLGPDYTAANLYQHCELEDLELAKVLVRPSGFFFKDVAMKSLFTKEKYGSVSRVYLVCEDDRIMEEKFQRYLIHNSPPQEVRTIAGADHMVMLSKRKELCQSLQEIAEAYH